MEISRTTALAARHLDLGGDLQEYIRMAVPMTYGTSLRTEHDTVQGQKD